MSLLLLARNSLYSRIPPIAMVPIRNTWSGIPCCMSRFEAWSALRDGIGVRKRAVDEDLMVVRECAEVDMVARREVQRPVGRCNVGGNDHADVRVLAKVLVCGCGDVVNVLALSNHASSCSLHCSMRPLPAQASDVDRRWGMRVPADPMLRFDTNDYSLDPALVGRRMPSEIPRTNADSEPTASITARTSSIRSSSVGISWTNAVRQPCASLVKNNQP